MAKSVSMSKENGFTLIEVILTMVLVGIMVSMAGMGIVIFMQSYATARENVAISQKAALVRGRISRELEALSVVDATSNSTCIRYRIGTDPGTYRRIQYQAGRIELNLASASDCSGSEPGKALTDRVQAGSFSLGYQTFDAGSQALVDWDPATDDFASLDSVYMTFTLERKDGLDPDAFSITINPRNTRPMKGPGVSFENLN